MDLFRHPGGGHKKIKGPTHMVEVGHHLRKAPDPHPDRQQVISWTNAAMLTKVSNDTRFNTVAHKRFTTYVSCIMEYSSHIDDFSST